MAAQGAKAAVERGTDAPNEDDLKAIESVQKISYETWFEISRWARETENLDPWQRSLAYSIGKLLKADRNPSRKQAQQAVKLAKEAIRLGFKRGR